VFANVISVIAKKSVHVNMTVTVTAIASYYAFSRVGKPLVIDVKESAGFSSVNPNTIS